MKGIDKRTHKDGTVSYRARARTGAPVLFPACGYEAMFSCDQEEGVM